MINSLAIVAVAVALVGWMAYLMVSSVRSQAQEEVPANLSPPMSNKELETTRLETTRSSPRRSHLLKLGSSGLSSGSRKGSPWSCELLFSSLSCYSGQ